MFAEYLLKDFGHRHVLENPAVGCLLRQPQPGDGAREVHRAVRMRFDAGEVPKLAGEVPRGTIRALHTEREVAAEQLDAGRSTSFPRSGAVRIRTASKALPGPCCPEVATRPVPAGRKHQVGGTIGPHRITWCDLPPQDRRPRRALRSGRAIRHWLLSRRAGESCLK